MNDTKCKICGQWTGLCIGHYASERRLHTEWNETCSQAPCNHEPSVPTNESEADAFPANVIRVLRESLETKDRRIAELEAALKELQSEFFAHQEDPQRSVTYKWSLTRIGYALADNPSALDAMLAQAKREALEYAARQIRSCLNCTHKYASFTKVMPAVERVINDCADILEWKAREVKP